MISTARKRLQAFTVYEVKTEEVIHFKSWWPKHFKKITKALPSTSSPGTNNSTLTVMFSVSKYRYIEYNSTSPGCVMTSEFIGCCVKDVFCLQKHNVALSLPSEGDKAYSAVCPINRKKVDDVRLYSILYKNLRFYDSILHWPQKHPLMTNKMTNIFVLYFHLANILHPQTKPYK